jgi:hypothetical protein
VHTFSTPHSSVNFLFVSQTTLLFFAKGAAQQCHLPPFSKVPKRDVIVSFGGEAAKTDNHKSLYNFSTPI